MTWNIFAYSGQPVAPDNLGTAWTFEPTLLLPLAITVLVYLWGIRNAWKRAGAGHGIAARRCIYFLGAILALVIALVSPLDALSGVLFSAHMVQHLILFLVAAPLLVMSDFPLALLWALPRRWAQALGRRVYHSRGLSRVWQAISSPVSAWLLFAITLWVWHASALFDAALRNEAVHAVEHLLFLVTAMLFWWVLYKPSGQHTVHYGVAIPYLFATTLHSTILGALMTFTTQPWYSYYTDLVPLWGMTPLQDQQLAGLIMWMPGGAVFTLLTIGYFAAWFRSLELRSETVKEFIKADRVRPSTNKNHE